MSWNSYIDKVIEKSKDERDTHVDKVCIIGLDGGAAWTSDDNPDHFKLQGNEGSTIAKCMKTKDFVSFQSGGVYINDVKYKFIRSEDDKIVFAKLKEFGAITIQASKTAIVIAHTKEGCQQGIANKAVSFYAEHFESNEM